MQSSASSSLQVAFLCFVLFLTAVFKKDINFLISNWNCRICQRCVRRMDHRKGILFAATDCGFLVVLLNCFSNFRLPMDKQLCWGMESKIFSPVSVLCWGFVCICCLSGCFLLDSGLPRLPQGQICDSDKNVRKKL